MAKAKLNLREAEKIRTQVTKEMMKETRTMFEKLAEETRKQAEIIGRRTNISSVMREKYLGKLANQMDEEVKKITEALDKKTRTAMETVASGVVESNEKFLKEHGFLSAKGFLSKVPTDVVTIVANGKLYEEGWSLSSAIWGINEKAHKDIHKVIAEGIAQNKSAYDVAKDLEKYVDPSARKGWEWAKVYPGTSKKIDYSAQRLARTMISHAYQQSFVMETQDNPLVEDYIWHSALIHGRTCQLCIERDGRHFKKDELPLDHPNGLCWFEASITKSSEEVADEIAKWYDAPDGAYPEMDKFAKSLGWKAEMKPQAKLNPNAEWYSEWAKKLSAKEKKSMVSDYGDLKFAYNNLIHGVKVQIISKGKPQAIVPSSIKTGKYDRFVGLKETKQIQASAITREKMDKMREGIVDRGSDRYLEIKEVYEKDTEKWLKKLTVAEREAVTEYTGSAFNDINNHLRGINSYIAERYEKAIPRIRSAIKKDGISEETVVLRTSSVRALQNTLSNGKVYSRETDWLDANLDKLKNVVIEDKAFMSTTGASSHFGDVQFYIHLPKGTKAPYIAPISNFGSEEEILLQAGTKLRVIELIREKQMMHWGEETSSYKVYLQAIVE